MSHQKKPAMSSDEKPDQQDSSAAKQKPPAATNYHMLTPAEVAELLRLSKETGDFALKAFRKDQRKTSAAIENLKHSEDKN